MGLICANWNGTYSMYVRAKAKIVELIHSGERVASCFRRDTYLLCYDPSATSKLPCLASSLHSYAVKR